MLAKLLILIVPFVGVILAGGDVSCDAVFEKAAPTFFEFSSNVSRTITECNDKVEMLSKSNVSSVFKAISTECSNSFVGFLLEAVSRLSELTGIDSSEILDVATGGARLPFDVPLKCIGEELTSMFPNILEANSDIQAKIDQIMNGDN